MKKSSSAALFAVLALIALLPAIGCGEGAAAKIENAPADPKAFGEQPPDPNKVVDSQVSWRKFVAEAKLPERSKLAEKHFIDQCGAAATLKVVFMKDEIEYVKFGDKSPIKGIDPTRLYEVGVMTLAAKENWGAEGYQIREYSLKFITPRRDGDWKYAMGTYRVTKFSGSRKADPLQLQFLRDQEYQQGHLRHLFVKPLPAKPGPVAPVINQGGEQPVPTVIKP